MPFAGSLWHKSRPPLPAVSWFSPNISRYDVSAFNIVLGQMFNFQESEYLGQKEFFRKVDRDPKETGGKNSTSSSSSSSDPSSTRDLEM